MSMDKRCVNMELVPEVGPIGKCNTQVICDSGSGVITFLCIQCLRFFLEMLFVSEGGRHFVELPKMMTQKLMMQINKNKIK